MLIDPYGYYTKYSFWIVSCISFSQSHLATFMWKGVDVLLMPMIAVCGRWLPLLQKLRHGRLENYLLGRSSSSTHRGGTSVMKGGAECNSWCKVCRVFDMASPKPVWIHQSTRFWNCSMLPSSYRAHSERWQQNCTCFGLQLAPIDIEEWVIIYMSDLWLSRVKGIF